MNMDTRIVISFLVLTLLFIVDVSEGHKGKGRKHRNKGRYSSSSEEDDVGSYYLSHGRPLIPTHGSRGYGGGAHVGGGYHPSGPTGGYDKGYEPVAPIGGGYDKGPVGGYDKGSIGGTPIGGGYDKGPVGGYDKGSIGGTPIGGGYDKGPVPDYDTGHAGGKPVKGYDTHDGGILIGGGENKGLHSPETHPYDGEGKIDFRIQ